MPEDIAVVGFSNEPFSELVTPSISTVKQPGFSMGKKAAKLIIQQIMENNKKTTKIEAAIKDTKLRLEHVKQEIMLMSRERDTLQKQLDSLETIQDSKHFE